MKTLHPDRRRVTRGFTMLELLIVVGIIALLAAISFGVIGSIFSAAKETATRTTITKIDGLLRGQIAAFYKHHDPRKPETQTLAGKFRSAPYFLTADRETSLVLATKASFQRVYPQNLYETAGFDRMPGTADDIPLFIEWLADHNPASPSYAASNVSEADSSELLYLAMTEGKVLGVPPVARSEFTAAEVGDTDKDGWKEFIDAWGRPLRYYRWPTRLVNPLGFVASVHDPADTDGLIIGEMSIQLVSGTGNAFNTLTPPFRVVVGREVIEIGSVSGDTLNVTQRGDQSTDEADHPAGSKVKLAPFTDLATILLGFVNSDVLSKDPDDNFGSVAELHPPAQITAGDALANIRQLAAPPFFGGEVVDYELLFHTLDSYQAPLIVSAGPDGELGLIEPGPILLTTGPPATPDPTELRNPQNIWIPGTSLNGSGTPDAWQWGTLAQPDTKGGTDLSILTNPGGSVLNDNITNYNGSN